jgi:hypothetical protein
VRSPSPQYSSIPGGYVCLVGLRHTDGVAQDQAK